MDYWNANNYRHAPYCAKCGNSIASYENVLCDDCKHTYVQDSEKPFNMFYMEKRYTVLSQVWSRDALYMVVLDNNDYWITYRCAYSAYDLQQIATIGRCAPNVSDSAYVPTLYHSCYQVHDSFCVVCDTPIERFYYTLYNNGTEIVGVPMCNECGNNHSVVRAYINGYNDGYQNS